MANTILQIKHSTFIGNTPSSLANGEIAINSRDGKLFYSTPSGVVTQLSSASGPSGLNKEIQFNDSGSLGGNNKLTFDKTTGELVVNGTVRANIFSDDGINLLDYSTGAFNTANAAFLAANNATDTYVRNHANASFNHANAAFNTANSISTSITTVAVFETTSNGSVATYDIGFNPVSSQAMLITIDGIVQPTSTYSVNSAANTITFNENPSNGELIRAASFFTNASVTYFQSLPSNVTPSIFETTANGSVGTFDVGFSTGSASSLLVSIAGIVQPTSAYTVNANSTTISFVSDYPANGEILRVVSFYSATNAYVINDASVSFAKFDSNVASTIINTQNKTNAAFDAANSAIAAITDTYARNTANAAFIHTNAAFEIANSASNTALSSFHTANAAFDSANDIVTINETQNTTIQTVYNHVNAAFAIANAGGASVADTYSRNHSNASFDHANASFAKANTAFTSAAAIDGINNTQNNSITAAFAAANSAANSTADIFARNTANAAFSKANTGLANTSGATFDGELKISGVLRALSAGGDEGGEIILEKPVSNTSINGSVTIDVYQNKFRIFETGGSNRGVFINLIATGASTTTNLLDGATTDTYARNHANAAFQTANSGGAVTDTYARNQANAAFTSANNIDGINATQNNSITAAFIHANSAFVAANNATDTYVRNHANAAFIHANSAFQTANQSGGGTSDTFARNQANAAFDKANTSSGALSSRATVSTTTTSLASNASANATVTMAKGYGLYKIAVSTGAWVTVYGNIALRNSDFTRSISTDPVPGSGVLAEAITTGTTANVTLFTPSLIGYNDDVSVSTNAYLKIFNNSGTTNTVTVTITYLSLEV